jgi:hypothetical protein
VKKIPTILERDWNGDRSRVLDVPNPECAWVFAGEGKATRKLDGTCCMVRDGKLYKRREFRGGEHQPQGFEYVDQDIKTNKIVGWIPVSDGPEDQYHREAFAELTRPDRPAYPDGTYELIGPKIQGNPERMKEHVLCPHAYCETIIAPHLFADLKAFLAEQDLEGLVWHHPDGRMAKIKLKDFGLKRRSTTAR